MYGSDRYNNLKLTMANSGRISAYKTLIELSFTEFPGSYTTFLPLY